MGKSGQRGVGGGGRDGDCRNIQAPLHLEWILSFRKQTPKTGKILSST